MKNYVDYKLSKRSRKRRASEGMTAAIILIAFIITAAGIAFVILTMGSEMQLELGNIGEQGKDSASSAMQVEGGIVTGYSTGGTTVTAFAFNVKLVLATGQVDLSADAVEVWIIIAHDEEQNCSSSGGSANIATAAALNAYTYDVTFYDDNSNEVLDPNEMARFVVSTTTAAGATESEDVVIIINSGVATLKISKTIPKGLITGLNML